MKPPARRRFLLSCFACDPGAGSEPYVGWHWAATVYATRDRVVLTRSHHRAALEPHAGDGLAFRFFDLPFLAGLDHRHRLMKLYYILWQIAVLPYAAWIVWRERITDIHHVTYNAVDFPGQSCVASRSATSGTIAGTGRPNRAAAARAKCAKRRGASSLRSRKGGMRSVTTFSR